MLPGVGVTAVLPRRSYAPIVGRLLHDRTADKMAAVISRIPHAAATIVPFDVRSRVESMSGRGPAARADSASAVPKVRPPLAQPHAAMAERATQADQPPAEPGPGQLPQTGTQPDATGGPATVDPHARTKPSKTVTPIGSLTTPGRAVIARAGCIPSRSGQSSTTRCWPAT